MKLRKTEAASCASPGLEKKWLGAKAGEAVVVAEGTTEHGTVGRRGRPDSSPRASWTVPHAGGPCARHHQADSARLIEQYEE